MPVLGALLGLFLYVVFRLGLRELVLRIRSRVQTARNLSDGDPNKFLKVLVSSDLPYLKR